MFAASVSQGLWVQTSREMRQNLNYSSLAWLEKTGAYEIFDGQETVLSNTTEHHDSTEPVIERSSEEDMAWEPVVSLIKILPGLATLEYNCNNQFPPLLLDAIHEHKCKLHHMTF